MNSPYHFGTANFFAWLTGIAIAFGANAGTIQTVTGAVTALTAAMTYIITEGKIYAASVGETTQKVQDAVEDVKNEVGG